MVRLQRKGVVICTVYIAKEDLDVTSLNQQLEFEAKWKLLSVPRRFIRGEHNQKVHLPVFQIYSTNKIKAILKSYSF